MRNPARALNTHRAPALHSFWISAYICCGILLGCVTVSNQFLHWFVIPVLICGTLIGTDAVDSIRGHLDVFDPVGIIGLLGFHFFFLAPLLHVYWDYWMLYIDPPPDWRDWLGEMAVLNMLGLIVYHISRTILLKERQKHVYRTLWRVDWQNVLPVVGIALFITGGLQLWVYARSGGILGYIQIVTDGSDGFRGFGWIFMISESFPIVAFMLFAMYATRKKFFQSWMILVIVLAVYLVLKILFGGLRGSRSNTVWGLFWAIGIIHFWIRPISRQWILTGCLFLILFMYFYGFYKSAGLDGLEAFQSSAARAELTEQTGRSLEGLLLGDLARSDIQAFLLYRLRTYPTDYEYALGKTYLGGATILIPRSIWSNRPLGKVKEGTEAQYGKNSYRPGAWESSKVYGLAGEAMLNFGSAMVPPAFLLFGVVVGYVQRLMTRLHAMDIRCMLLPFLINLCFVVLVSDSDNIVFFLIKDGFVPFIVLFLCTKKLSFISSNSGLRQTCNVHAQVGW